MFKNPCRCSTHDKAYGPGGGGGSVKVPSLGSEIKGVTGGFQHNVYPSYQQFTQNEPLLQNLSQFGLQTGQAIEPYLLQEIQSGGALTPQEDRAVTQNTNADFQSRGNLFGNQAIGSLALNRDIYKQQKLQTALGEAGQTEQLLGYPEQQQTGNYATLTNPLYGLAAAQLGAQTQAGIAGQQAASANKGGTSSLIGSGVGALATVGVAL